MTQVADDRGVVGKPVTFVGNRLEIAVPRGNPANVRGLADFTRAGASVRQRTHALRCGLQRTYGGGDSP